VERCSNVEELMGIEGSVAAIYFSNWRSLLAEGAAREAFAPYSRNRRPPKDPVNAMLSFGYALLAKEATVACWPRGWTRIGDFCTDPGTASLRLRLISWRNSARSWWIPPSSQPSIRAWSRLQTLSSAGLAAQ